MASKVMDKIDGLRGPDHTARADVNGQIRRTKEAVLATTYKLMSETGIGGVNIEEVARRSGVAKTTIYRHWQSRSALLLDACSRLGSRPEVPDTGSLRGDLTVLLTRLAEQLRTASWPAILPSIIDAAERDPDIAQLHARLQAGFSAPYLAAIERAKRRGELPSHQDASELLASMVGSLFFRRWFSREPLDVKFVKRLITRVAARRGTRP
jgi:AcrR family transcriptional regulator